MSQTTNFIVGIGGLDLGTVIQNTQSQSLKISINGSIAVGNLIAGTPTQGANAIAIGTNAGQTTQGGNAIAIGTNAGRSSQVTTAIAIGEGAGEISQGSGSIAIGKNAGNSGQALNSIQINATGVSIAQTTASTCVIAPIRSGAVATTDNALYYNATTSEVFRSLPPASSVLGGDLSGGQSITASSWVNPNLIATVTTKAIINLPSAGVYLLTYSMSIYPPAGGVVLMGCLSENTSAPYSTPQTTQTSSNLLGFSSNSFTSTNWVSATNTVIYTATASINIYLYVAVSVTANLRGGSGSGCYFRAVRLA